MPDLPLTKAARVINIITALTGLAASGMVGLALLLSKLAIVPLLIAPFLFVMLYWGCACFPCGASPLLAQAWAAALNP